MEAGMEMAMGQAMVMTRPAPATLPPSIGTKAKLIMSEASTESAATANVLPRILYIERARPFQPRHSLEHFRFSPNRENAPTLSVPHFRTQNRFALLLEML